MKQEASFISCRIFSTREILRQIIFTSNQGSLVNEEPFVALAPNIIDLIYRWGALHLKSDISCYKIYFFAFNLFSYPESKKTFVGIDNVTKLQLFRMHYWRNAN